MAVASVSGSITQFIGNYGLYAVFVLMMIDAVFPAASELVMVYAGAIASGAITGQSVSAFGHTFPPGFPAYCAVAIAGTVGYLIGSLGGWEIGRRGGRTFLERNGRWFHLDQSRLRQADAWFSRWGSWAILIGRVTPVVRSFISIPAGVFDAPLPRYTVLTLIGSAVWCFAFAAIGWAGGASWESFHSGFRFADAAVAVTVVGALCLVAGMFLKRRRS